MHHFVVYIADIIVICKHIAFSDINKAVEELASLYNIDVQEKRRKLLNSWLWSGVQNFSMDVSICAMVAQDSSNNSSDNLIRLV